MIFIFLLTPSILLIFLYYYKKLNLFFIKKYLLKEKNKLPSHVAIIMDGNRRWAKKRKMPSYVGHSFGAKNIKNIIDVSLKLGIKYLTFYTLSIENLKRSEIELNHIFKLLEKYISDTLIKDYISKNNILIKTIGNLELIDVNLKNKIELFVDSFEENPNPKLIIQFAIAYSGREEIIHSFQSIIRSNKILKIDENLVSKYLYNQNIPDPDLMIRTGGEERISNFLLWQIAYTELLFSKKMWPEFDKYEFYKSVLNYINRKRRYGK